MTLPSQNQKLVDDNGRIDPYWRRWFQTIDTLLELLQSQTTESLIEQLEGFKTQLETLEATSLLRAEFEALNGQSQTQLDNLRDNLNKLGDEVSEATQVSTQNRLELFGQNEQRIKEINSLVAKTNSTNASVTTLSEAFATEQTAVANQFTQVQTSVDGNTASVTQLQSSVDGIEAQYAIALDVNGDVIGYIQLSGVGGVSDFSVVANNFKVAHPNSGTPISIFTATLDGESNPILQVNGYVQAENINGTNITGININGSVITGALFQSPGGGITIDGQDENNLSITLGAT